MIRPWLLAVIFATAAVSAPCYDRAGLEEFEKRLAKVGSAEFSLCFKLPFGGVERAAVVLLSDTGRSWEPKLPTILLRKGLVMFAVPPQDPPAPLEAALAWIRRNSQELGVDSRKIALIGVQEGSEFPTVRLDRNLSSIDQVDKFLAGLGWLAAK